MACVGLAEASQSLSFQRQYPPFEFGVLFDPVGEVPLEPLNRFFAANLVSDAERIAKIPVLSSTGPADVNVKRFLIDIHNECLHCSPVFSWSAAGRSRLFTPPIFTSLFH
jgi:hypothetical protein